MSTFCPRIFVTSLAGNGGKVEESFTPDGSIPTLGLGCGESTIINIEGMDGRGGVLLGTTLVLPAGGSRLRDTGGMVATETKAEAGVRRPRAVGKMKGGVRGVRFSISTKNNTALAAIARVYLPISTVKIPPSLQASI